MIQKIKHNINNNNFYYNKKSLFYNKIIYKFKQLQKNYKKKT